MKRIAVAVCLVFILALPSFADSWTIVDDSAPFDPLLAESIRRWRNQHNWEIRTSLTDEQQRISRELVRGTLRWAYSHGNTFDADEFLDTFKNRDESVYVIRYPDGGIGFVIRGAYLRIQFDRSKPNQLPLYKLPEEGRWFAEIGCDSHSQLFYFNGGKPRKVNYLASQTGSDSP